MAAKKKAPAMKTAEDAEVKELIEEAHEDLEDARALASTMGTYHAAAAAEKFLRALALAANRQASPMWGVGRVHAAVADVEGMEAVADDVKALAEFATPAKAQGSGGRFGAAMSAARRIRAAVLPRLGVEVPPEAVPAPPPVAPQPQPQQPAGPSVEEIEARYEQQPRDYANVPPAAPGEGPGPEGDRHRGDDRGRGPRPPDRRGYVGNVLLCQRCGVRLPRTRQTAFGAPCPHCGRPMVMTQA
ncbi:MAG: hypothetical protein FJ087_09460 [Deltaproteobacteria bacterium]|nr:hypothetical protein [Deltaproteobacteria bacterium]